MKKFIELLQNRPLLAPLIALGVLIVGLVLGLVIGWMTVDFKPSADDVVMAADAFDINNDAAFAKRFLKGLSNDDLSKLLSDLYKARIASNKPLEAARLKKLGDALGVSVATSVPPAGTSVPSATRPPGASSSASSTATQPAAQGGGFDPLIAILGILLVIVLAAAAGLIFVRRILPTLNQPRAPRTAAAPTTVVAAQPSASPDLRYGAAPAPTTSAGGLGRFVPTYVLGNDNYDTSYSLEAAKGEFLGECGMGISETIGEGKPDKVTAFDLWLFDKADVRTVTQIVMSDYAYKDQTLRTKLGTKGEAVLAEKGKTLHLETQSLSIDAHIVELVYANNPSFPPNSHFQKLVVEIVPVHKDGAGTR